MKKYHVTFLFKRNKHTAAWPNEVQFCDFVGAVKIENSPLNLKVIWKESGVQHKKYREKSKQSTRKQNWEEQREKERRKGADEAGRKEIGKEKTGL